MVVCPVCGEKSSISAVAGPSTAYLQCGHQVHPAVINRSANPSTA